MDETTKLSVKAFWEAVEAQLAACSAEDLRAILRTLAQETPPAGRAAFLARLKPAATELSAAPILELEDLLAGIADLAQEIAVAMEDADALEEASYERGAPYDDEDSLGPYEDFVESLVDLFTGTQAAFEAGDCELAAAAYRELFSLLNQEDDYGRGVQLSDLAGVDAGETVSRYLRAIYETTPPAERPATLYELMRAMRPLLSRRARLNDLIQISSRPLPDQETFLADWIAYLRTQDTASGSDGDAWLREAVELAQGVAGLAALARAEGVTRPRAYLDWFAALERAGQTADIIPAAQAALQALPDDLPIRAAIADQLCAAAAQLKQDEVVREGRWQAFVAKPAVTRLLDLWEMETDAAARTALMAQALRRIEAYVPPPAPAGDRPWRGDALEVPAPTSAALAVHAAMLAGEWDVAQGLAAYANVLGWSYTESYQGLVVGVFLTLLSGKPPDALPGTLAAIWREGLQNSLGFSEQFSPAGAPLLRLERAYATQLAQTHWPADVQTRYLDWCLDVVRQRVAAIVGGQHRKSYDKAAVLLAAGAETLRSRGDSAAAGALVAELRERFRRHSAFQAEVKRVWR
ncbi:MAG: hypothetical protein JXA21_13310 [Anaerolineae bacterium]|nr:hypothetical protein [Anaerolineae bacterium]